MTNTAHTPPPLLELLSALAREDELRGTTGAGSRLVQLPLAEARLDAARAAMQPAHADVERTLLAAQHAVGTWRRVNGDADIHVLLGEPTPLQGDGRDRSVRLPTAARAGGRLGIDAHDAWVYQSALRVLLALLERA